MISTFSLKIPRVLLVIFVILNAVILFTYLFRYETLQQYKENIKNLSGKYDYSYLSDFNFYEDSKESVIEPGKVKFRFVNPKKKKGNPKQVLDINMKKYEEVMSREIKEPKDCDIESLRPTENPKYYKRANATILALVRNQEKNKISKTIKTVENKFNSKFRYPYTFINDKPFTDSFKEKVSKLTEAPIEYVVIPSELWDKPSHIDSERERAAIESLKSQDVSYAGMPSYHNMCRFYLGNLFFVPELMKYRYYWRIEPDVEYFSELHYDIFKYLEQTKKVYGFTVSLYDIGETITQLWPETLKFLNMDDNYKYVNPNGSFQWLLENQQNPKKNEQTHGYSTCHFWSNFEVGDMEFFRGEAYQNWFKYLDQTGNFYYERWGDAPVHSVGLGLFADKKDIHWFRDIGYYHDPYYNCPNTPYTLGCEKGRFTVHPTLYDQNCIPSWIDYSMDNLDAIY